VIVAETHGFALHLHEHRLKSLIPQGPVSSWMEIGGKRLPVLRWSVLRMVFGTRHLLANRQVGDGREEALARHVTTHARAGDVDDVIRTIDDFCYGQSFMMNVGDEKGKILDRAVQRTRPRRLLSSAPIADTARSAWPE
jgi:hypothetical protein